MQHHEREPVRPQMSDEEELAAFRRRLAETMAWCSRAPLEDPLRSLRSAELAPNPFATDVWDLLYGVGEKRRVELERGQSFLKRRLPPASDLGGGKLVLYDPGMNLADGAAEMSSRGFFDLDNIPPWDTWVWPSRKWKSVQYLVSWVPPVFIDLAQEGISVNPEQCIRWVEDSDDAFIELLRQSDFV